MAVTIQQAAPSYSPVFNPVWFVISSTNTAQANFEHICDLYITGVTPAYFRLRVPADATNGRGVFDVGKILEKYLTSDIDDTTTSFRTCPNSIKEYRCKFGESYGPSSGVVVYPDLTVDSLRYVFNGVFDFLEFKDYAEGTYITKGTGRRMLTDRATSGVIREDTDTWLHVLSNTADDIEAAFIITYDSNGNVIGSTRVTNTLGNPSAAVENRHIRFGAGPKNLNAVSANMIPSNAVKYLVYFEDSGPTRVSEIQWFVIDRACTGHTIYTLHFLNQKGGFDSFSFIRASVFKTDITRSNYQKTSGKYLTTNSYGYLKKDRHDIKYDLINKDTVTIESDWITESELEWLEQLLTSPEIYYADATHKIVSVNIITTTHIRRKHITDKVINLRIDIQYSFTRFRQRA